jgi:hypothetical protein
VLQSLTTLLLLNCRIAANNLVKGWREAKDLEQSSLAAISRLRQQHGRPEFTLDYFNRLWADEQLARAREASAATTESYKSGLVHARLWILGTDYLRAKNHWTTLTRDSAHTQSLDIVQSQVQDWTTFAQIAAASQKLQDAQTRLVEFLGGGNRVASFQNDSRLAEWLLSAEGQAGKVFHLRHAYHQALDSLELACVDRFAEAEKCCRPGTNYKMRAKIAGALRSRNQRIETAYKRYDQAWTQLPLQQRPGLLRREVLKGDQDSVSQAFAVARDGLASFSQEDWAQPTKRDGVRQARLHACAVFELKQLDIEIARLRLWIQSEPQRICCAVNSRHLKLPISAIWHGGPNSEDLDCYPTTTIPMLALLRLQEKLQQQNRTGEAVMKELCKLDIPAPTPEGTMNHHIMADRAGSFCRNPYTSQHMSAHLSSTSRLPVIPEEGQDPQTEAQLPGLNDNADDALEAPE